MIIMIFCLGGGVGWFRGGDGAELDIPSEPPRANRAAESIKSPEAFRRRAKSAGATSAKPGSESGEAYGREPGKRWMKRFVSGQKSKMTQYD